MGAIEVTDGDVTTYIVIEGADTAIATLNTLTALARSDADLNFSVVDAIPEGAEGFSPTDYFSSFEFDRPPGDSTAFEIYVRDTIDLADAIESGGSSGGGSRSSGGGGGSSRRSTAFTDSNGELDLAAIAREQERLDIEGQRLGVTENEIGQLQALNAEDRALIIEQFDLQREESQRAFVLEADPARSAVNNLSGGNFKSGVSDFDRRVRRLTQDTEIDQLENSRARSLNSNSAAGVRLDASGQRNALDQQEFGLAQDAFNDTLAEIGALGSVTDVVGGGSFGETILGSIGL